MVNNSSKLNNLCFDTCIITFPSKEKGEFDQPNSLDLSLITSNKKQILNEIVCCKIYLLSFWPFVVSNFLIFFLTIICYDWDEFGSFLAGFGWFQVVSGWIRVVSAGFWWFRLGSGGFIFNQLPLSVMDKVYSHCIYLYCPYIYKYILDNKWSHN